MKNYGPRLFQLCFLLEVDIAALETEVFALLIECHYDPIIIRQHGYRGMQEVWPE